MSTPIANNSDSHILRSVVEHVFMPPKLPQKDPGEQIQREMNVALCDYLIGAARDFLQDIHPSQHPLWMRMIKMIYLARRAAEVPFEEAELRRVFSDMAIGGMSIQLALFHAINQTFLYQTFFPCIFAHKTLVSLCADFPPANSFNSRCSKFRLRMPT